MASSRLGSLASKVTTQDQLRQLHAKLVQISLYRHNYWVALLLQHCTRLHSPPSYAHHAFCCLPCPHVHAFHSIVKHCFRFGAQDRVASLFVQMRGSHARPDSRIYQFVIRSAGKDGVLFHASVLKLGFGCDIYLRNVVMDVYAKHGPIESARKVFDEISDRTVADWNSMIAGYWRWGDEAEACRLFEMMPERNVVSWTTMVTGYAKGKHLVRARKYFDYMPEKNVVSWNAMLSGYVQNGFADEALRLFDDMMEAGFEPNETTWVAIITAGSLLADPCLAESLVKVLKTRQVFLNCFLKTALLDMHAKCGNLETAREIFDELGVHKNHVSWNAMISAYTRVGDLTSARGLFDNMPERDAVSWNSMLAGYAQTGHSVMAIELFKEMIADGNPKPDEVTAIIVFSACGNLGALGIGNSAVTYLIENQINLSISGYNSLIFMYCKGGSVKDAKRIFNVMRTRDVVSYNTMIAGLAAHGHGTEALQLMSEMKQEGIEPDHVTYTGVLTACSHAGLLVQGRNVFKSIKSPHLDHYACMVDLLGRAGELDDAKRLIDCMPMEPHAGIYGSLLNSSRIHRRVELGEFAANRLFEIEPNNSGNYVLLSNIYASEGRWKDVDNVRGAMKRVGVQKATAWSWIEHGVKIHKFIVGDKSHERSEDIYCELVELARKMGKFGYTTDNSYVLKDVEEEDKEAIVGAHSEKLAVSFGLLVSEERTVIRVVKNLRICLDCHNFMKMVSLLEGREISVRDNNRFHQFVDGLCSCKDYW